MKASSTLQPPSQSAFQHRQQEKQQQAIFLKLAVPIALILHGMAIGGGLLLIGRSSAAIDEVEIITGENSTSPDQTPEASKSLAGGGDLKLSLFQSQALSGTKDGNNIPTLGNPFASPDVKAPEVPSIEPPQVMPSDASTEAIADDTIDLDKKPIDPKKKTESKSIGSNLTDKKNNPGNLGDLNGEKGGKNQRGNNTANNPSLPLGAGNGPVTTNPNTSIRKADSPTSSAPMPLPVIVPASSTAPQKPPVAIVTPTRPVPKKAPQCLENCSLNEYLGSEGKADIRLTVDRDGNVIEATLGRSSGNEEVDRKALEYARTRKYKPSDEGFSSNLPITSQQEGSEFSRQQEERRRQEQAERAISTPQPPAAEGPATPIEPIPAAEPIAKPIPESAPQAIPESIPQPATPAVPQSIIEPINPVPSPIAPPVAEPIANPIPEPITPQSTVAEPTVAEPIDPIIPAPATP